MKKKNLIILLGGSEKNMRERINYSLKNFSLNDSDIVFTGFQRELGFLKKFLEKTYNQHKIKEFYFVPSYDTWTNIRNTQAIWQEYDNICCATEKWHGKRSLKLFHLLGRKRGLKIEDTKGEEAANARLLCVLYSTRISAWGMSVIARILRLLKK